MVCCARRNMTAFLFLLCALPRGQVSTRGRFFAAMNFFTSAPGRPEGRCPVALAAGQSNRGTRGTQGMSRPGTAFFDSPCRTWKNECQLPANPQRNRQIYLCQRHPPQQPRHRMPPPCSFWKNIFPAALHTQSRRRSLPPGAISCSIVIISLPWKR